MKRFSPGFWSIFLTGLLAASVASAAEPEVGDSALADAVALYRAQGPEAALPEFERLLTQFREAQALMDEARTLRFLGDCHWRLGELGQSRAYLDQALATLSRLNAPYEEGKTLNVLGLLEWDLGNYPQALDALGRAREIARRLGDDELEASSLNNIALVHDELGEYQTSLAEYREAYELFSAIGDLRGQSNALGNIGGVHLLLGRYSEALDHHQRALALSEQIGSKPSMTIDHGNIALSFLGLGRYPESLAHFDQALELAAQTGMRHEEAYWRRGKANAYIRQGKYDLGLDNHRAALAAYEETGARGLLLEALHDLGDLYLELDDPVSAEANFRHAIELAREIGHEQSVTQNLLALGNIHLLRERPEEAIALFLQARERAASAGELNLQAEASLSLSRANRESERFEEALEHASAALALTRKFGSPAAEAWALFNVAESELARTRAVEAKGHYNEAEEVAGEDGDPDLLWQLHFGRAKARVLLGNRQSAIDDLLAAVEIIESVRDRLREDRFQAGYLQDKYEVYVELVRLQLQSGQAERAFSTAERLRAHSFLVQLERELPRARTASERDSEMELRERIRQLQRGLLEEQRKARSERRQLAMNTFSAELAAAEREYQEFLDDVSGQSARSATIDTPQMDQIKAVLHQDEVLVEYLVSNEQLIIFVLHSQGLLTFTHEIGKQELGARVRLLRDLIQQPGHDRWRAPAQNLAETLIGPLRESVELAAIRHLYLVPHDLLNYLPFSALPAEPAGKRLLVDNYTLTYLPAAAALVRAVEPGSHNRSMLAMAPAAARLRHAPREARMVAALFGPDSRVLEGAEATENAFKHQAGHFNILHLATHGYFNRRNPLLSGLQLEADANDDGRLEVHEILDMRLGARLVTLSACETGLGSGWVSEMPVGDDFVGLTRAFLYAGSEAVMASLWEVDDRSTVGLMENFYRQLGPDPAGQAGALARVQRAMRASEDFNHPFYWAPFVLVGQHRIRAAQG